MEGALIVYVYGYVYESLVAGGWWRVTRNEQPATRNQQLGGSSREDDEYAEGLAATERGRTECPTGVPELQNGGGAG